MENLQGGTLALEHRYHVQQRIGRFGFTTVYHAVQEPFDHTVFISVFDALEQAGADRTLFDRIKNAAQLASTLDAPGILRTIDYGELDLGIPFVIWEQPSTQPSQSLAQYLNQRQTLPPADVATLITRLANILTPAHAANLPHGSLSPRWIFVPEQDDDLSVATIGHFQIGLTLREMLAMPSAILNTQALSPLPPEMFNIARAPGAENTKKTTNAEQNDNFSIAADIYALGAIAYEALVGVHPYFDDPTDASDGMIRIKTDEAPELASLGIDPAISNTIARALSLDPAKRWPTAEAFAKALAQATNPAQPVAQPVAQPAPAKPTPQHATPIRPRHDLAKVDLSETIPTIASAPNATDSDQHHPHPYLLTTLAAALLISNLIWFFAYVQQHNPEESSATTEAPQAAAPLNPTVLPSGLQLNSNPSGAQILLINPETPQAPPTELGTTPYSILSSLLHNDHALLELRKPGFENIRLELSSDHTGQDILLSLIPKK